MSRNLRRNVGAFTLIELLTVIAIIGILAAILIPVTGRVRASARMTSDSASMREIGKASLLYANDNRNMLPHGRNANGQVVDNPATSNPNAPNNVYQAIEPYFARKAVGNYSKSNNPVWYAKNAEAPPGTTTNIHFAFNPNVWRPQWAAKLAVVPNPSRTVLVGETNDGAGNGGSDFDPNSDPVFAPDVSTRYRISQPGNQALYLWVDGHVSAMVGNQNFKVNPTIWRWW